MLGSVLELLVEAGGTIDERASLLVKHGDPGVLGEALLFPLRKSAIALVDRALLSVAQFLV